MDELARERMMNALTPEVFFVLSEPVFRHVDPGPTIGDKLHRLPLHQLPNTTPGGDSESYCSEARCKSPDAGSSSENGDYQTMPNGICPSFGSPDKRHGSVHLNGYKRPDSNRPGSSDVDESESPTQEASLICRSVSNASYTTEVTAADFEDSIFECICFNLDTPTRCSETEDSQIEMNTQSQKSLLESLVDNDDVPLHNSRTSATQTKNIEYKKKKKKGRLEKSASTKNFKCISS